VRAANLDMDATLVDSEGMASEQIEDDLRESGAALPDIDHARYHGLSWERIAEVRPLAGLLVEEYTALPVDFFGRIKAVQDS
jgi:hypothetical protein